MRDCSIRIFVSNLMSSMVPTVREFRRVNSSFLEVDSLLICLGSSASAHFLLNSLPCDTQEQQDVNGSPRLQACLLLIMSVSLSSSSSRTSDVANPDYSPIVHPGTPYTSFKAFYPFYLGEHSARANRIMHLIGTSNALGAGVYGVLCAIAALAVRLRGDIGPSLPKRLRPMWGAKGWFRLAIATIVQGYAWAWVGHALIERNRPATFKVSV
jgi:hypothetical protein